MEEIWKPVPFAPAYKASSEGNILGLRGKLLHPSINHRGYLVCDLHKCQYRVNRIICFTFHGEPPSNEYHAAHKDNDKNNNKAVNLYWATPQQNSDDLINSGVNNGSNSWKAILSEDDVINIRKLHSEGFRMVYIAGLYPRVSYPAISAVVHRRSWKHLP